MIAKKKSLTLSVSDSVLLLVEVVDDEVDVSEEVSDMKYNPQYIVTIDVIRDKFSKSFRAIVLKGFFLVLTLRNLNIINKLYLQKENHEDN